MTPEQIKHLRGDMTTKEFAEIFMVSHRTVEGWEQGRSIRAPVKKRLEQMWEEKE